MKCKGGSVGPSLEQRLNSYALAASAAGVGLLALVQPAEAKIVYTRTPKVIDSSKRNYSLDLNHDRITDFIIEWRHSGRESHHIDLFVQPAAGNAAEMVDWKQNSSFPLALALNRGQGIGSSYNRFQSRRGTMVAYYWRSYQSLNRGYWFNVTDRYLGLKFVVNGNTHYGWARLSVSSGFVTATLTGYAYETIPNKSIITGKTKGADIVTIQDASLGHLARGASAIPAWRQNEQ